MKTKNQEKLMEIHNKKKEVFGIVKSIEENPVVLNDRKHKIKLTWFEIHENNTVSFSVYVTKIKKNVNFGFENFKKVTINDMINVREVLTKDIQLEYDLKLIRLEKKLKGKHFICNYGQQTEDEVDNGLDYFGNCVDVEKWKNFCKINNL